MAVDLTARGVPHPDDNDPVSAGNERIGDLAAWVNDHPGVSPLTTVQRDALAGAALWVGRVVWNTDDERLEQWNGTAWKPAGGGSGGGLAMRYLFAAPF
jgi:hypothetical protein